MEHALSLFGIDPDQIVFGNPVGDWIFALGIGLATFAVLLLARRHLTRQVDRYAGAHLPQGVRLLVMLVAQTRVFLLLALSLIVGSKYLDLGERAGKLTTAVIVTMVALQIGLWMSASVRFYLEEQSAASSDRNSRTMVTIVQFVADLLHAVLRNLADVQQAIGTGEDFDKRTEVDDAHDLAEIRFTRFSDSADVVDHLDCAVGAFGINGEDLHAAIVLDVHFDAGGIHDSADGDAPLAD